MTGDGAGAGSPLAPGERDAVERVLAAAWGRPVAVRSAVVVAERHHVVRVTAGDRRTTVVKRPRRPGDSDWGGEPDGLPVEWAALEHLAAVDPPVAPRLLGGDDASGLVVMEDLPAERSLAASLLGDDPAAARTDLVAYAEALAGMHAATIGTAAAFGAARARRGLAPAAPAWWLGRLAGATPRFLDLAAGLGVSVGGVAGDLAAVEAALTGTLVGLVHGDPCPDNTVLAGGRCRLIDFERAGAGSVALDLGYLLAPFPSCWCFGRLPADLAGAAVGAYEAVLTGAGVDLGDDWDRALAAALGLWAAARIVDVADRADDPVWGTTTRRPRLAAWTASFLAAPAAGELPHLVAAVGRWRDRAGLDGVAVPDYPALAAAGAPVGQAPEGWSP